MFDAFFCLTSLYLHSLYSGNRVLYVVNPGSCVPSQLSIVLSHSLSHLLSYLWRGNLTSLGSHQIGCFPCGPLFKQQQLPMESIPGRFFQTSHTGPNSFQRSTQQFNGKNHTISYCLTLYQSNPDGIFQSYQACSIF